MDGAVKGLEGWIACFEKASLRGVVRGTGADLAEVAPSVLSEAAPETCIAAPVFDEVFLPVQREERKRQRFLPMRRRIDRMSRENTPITIKYLWGHKHIIFYGQSRLLKTLYYFPYVQLGVIAIFILLGFIAFRSTKQDEQNRIWIGLAKETAHQLGTPTSSLLGWIEYLSLIHISEPTRH